MKKKIWTIAFILILSSRCFSQQTEHLIVNQETTLESISLNSMTKKISDAAKQYKQYAPIPRFAQFDYAFGADLDEYLKLNGLGILYLASMNQDSTELPVDRVYFKDKDRITELQLISFREIPVKDKTTLKVFGDNRVDFYYLIPYEITQTTGELFVDWSKTRKDFKLCQFPSDNILEFITDENKVLLPDPNKKISESALQTFAEREFQILLKKK